MQKKTGFGIFCNFHLSTRTMDEQLNIGTKILNGFLRVMVTVLVLILASVVIALILALFGFWS
ncbi:hypothetical protein SAMN06265375_101929 [Muriicola jejuensis]|nr:hypothetical protein SAMN06265375_101929 [Muriicola jejuensis]